MLAALRLMPLIARSLAQISLIPLGVPAMLAIFIVILQRSDLVCQWHSPTRPLH
jgi:alpha-1,2-mannosyltransferase